MNEFEKYPVLTQYIQEYASFGHFSNWSGFLATLNELLAKVPDIDTPDPQSAFEKEPVNFLLVNALKYLTEDQRRQLYDELGERLTHDLTDIEREATKLYPMPEEPAGYAEAYTLRNVRSWQQESHIACAKQFIDKVKGLEAENENLRNWVEQLKEEAKEWKREVAKHNL